MKKTFAFLLLFPAVMVSACAQSVKIGTADFEKAVSNFSALPEAEFAAWGFYMQNLNTSEPGFGHAENQLYIPASTIKLLTTSLSLETYGPDYCFETQIAYSGTIENGILSGDLHIIGGGDVTLGSKYFSTPENQTAFMADWAAALRKAGILSISGNVLVHTHLYDDEMVSPYWAWEDMGNYFAAGNGAVSFADNEYSIYFDSPAQAGALTTLRSVSLAGLVVDNRVTAADNNEDLAYIFGQPGSNHITIRGSIPKGRSNFKIRGSLPAPAMHLAQSFAEYLQTTGIKVSGAAQTPAEAPDNYQVIYRHQSPTLAEIIKITNQKSINLFADQLLAHIPVKYNQKGSIRNGLPYAHSFLDSVAQSNEAVFIADGSGMSRYNQISPKILVNLLIYTQQNSQNATVFLESLPISGVSGTLRYMGQKTTLAGKIQAKSGSFRAVRAYAGFFYPDADTKYAFAFLVNNYTGSGANMRLRIEQFFIDLMSE